MNRTICFFDKDVNRKISCITSNQEAYPNLNTWTKKTFNNSTYGQSITIDPYTGNIVYIDEYGDINYLPLNSSINQAPIKANDPSIGKLVKSKYIVAFNEIVFAVDNNNKLIAVNNKDGKKVLNVLTGDLSVMTNSNIDYSQDLNALYFIGQNGEVKTLEPTFFNFLPTGRVRSFSTSNSGKFGVNKTTGTVYYGRNDGKMYQNYWDASQGYYPTKYIMAGIVPDAGFTHYAYPNCFYIGANNQINMTYFAVSNCQPGVQRKSNDIDPQVITGHENTLSANISKIKVSPNPIENISAISFELEETSTVTIKLFDFMGNEVRSITNETFEKGSHEIPFDKSDLASGIYIISYSTNNNSSENLKVLIK